MCQTEMQSLLMDYHLPLRCYVANHRHSATREPNVASSVASQSLLDTNNTSCHSTDETRGRGQNGTVDFHRVQQARGTQNSLTSHPSYHFSRNSIKSFFQILKAKIELLSFNSKLLLHLSYNKMASVVPLLFINPNCISSISTCCQIPYSKILSIIFIACSNNLIHL